MACSRYAVIPARELPEARPDVGSKHFIQYVHSKKHHAATLACSFGATEVDLQIPPLSQLANIETWRR